MRVALAGKGEREESKGREEEMKKRMTGAAEHTMAPRVRAHPHARYEQAYFFF